MNEKNETLLGEIHEYYPWGININQLNEYLHLPLIKIWTGR